MESFRIVTLFWQIGLLIFGIIAGTRMWLVESKSIAMMKTYFWLAIAIGLLTLGLPYLTRVPERVADNLFIRGIFNFAATVIISAAWLTYLSKSKRVQVTFSV